MKKLSALSFTVSVYLSAVFAQDYVGEWERVTLPDGTEVCVRPDYPDFHFVPDRYDSKRTVSIVCRGGPSALEKVLGMALPDAVAGPTAPVALNFDNTVDTLYPEGDKPQGGSAPSGFTVASIGDVTTCDVSDSAGTTTVNVLTGGDEAGRCIIYKTAATDQDLHVEFELQASPTGDQSPFNGCGAFAAEVGTAISDYTSYTFYPIAGNTRLKTDAGGAGESVQFSGDGETLPEFILYQYDDTATTEAGAHGADGSTWTQIGSNVTKSLNFASNVRYGVTCFTDAAATGSVTFVITDLVADATTETLGGGGGGLPTLVFDEDFTSTTWYQRDGWGGGANGSGPTGDPRNADGGAAGNSFTRVTGTNNGVAEFDGAYGEVKITSGNRLGTNATIYISELGIELPTNGDEIWLQYMLAYGSTYDPVQAGKGPGFADDGSGACGAGGAPCDGTDGWTMRSKPGPCTPITQIRMDTYAYHADMPGTYGENFDWANMGCGGSMVINQTEWHCVEQYLKMNSVGASQNDGVFTVWVDGTQVHNTTNLQLDNAGNFPVERVWWNVYHGGQTPAPQDMHVYFDDIQVSVTSRINTCP